MKKLTSLTRFTLIAGLFLAAASSAFATVTITNATGGSTISADTASNAPSPAWTTLGAITITEGVTNDFINGTGVSLILKAPAGFQFNTAVTPNVTFTAGKNITSASAVMTDATNLTVTLTVSGTNATDSLTIGSTTGIQVRPTASLPFATGKHIYRPSTGGGTAVIKGITNSVDGSDGSNFGTLTEAPGTASATMPSQTQILSDMLLANNYFTNNWPTPGCSSCLSGGHASCIWTRATYIEGAMAMWRINPDPAITNYAIRWASFTNWNIRDGATGTSADDQCAGSEYIELYQLNTTLTNRITNIVANLNYWMTNSSGTKTDWWTYIDGIHMSMPAFAKMAAISGSSNTNYAFKMYSYFHCTKSTFGRSNGLYNVTDHLWWRDTNYLANYKASDGTTQKCYWSRGNGWVFAGLARVLDVLPSSDTNFAEYVQTFTNMAAALKPVQRSDGFWNMNLAYTNDYPGPESSGTAMFTYGLAWGIHHGYLDAATYLPTVIKGWNALATSALHHSPSTDAGFIGYVQSSGSYPTNNATTVTYTSDPDFDDFTLGALLLAGSEVYQLINLSQTVTFGALANHTYGDAPIILSASASSSLPVSFSILSGPASLVGNILTITGAGTVAVRASQAGNTTYAATNMDQSFIVSPATLTVSAYSQSKTYGDADPAFTWQITGGSLVSGDSFTGGLTREGGENVGTYAILQGTFTAGANYNLTYTGADLTINQKPIAVTADAKSKVYGDTDPALTWQLTGGSLVSGDSFAGGLTRAAGENAGAHAILQGTLTAGANYNLTYTGADLTISQKAITVTADNKSKTQGLANPVLTARYDGFVNGENTNALTTQVTLSTAADANSPAGTAYPIIASGAVAANYTISYVAGTLTVVARPDLAGISVSGNQFTLTWPTIAGQNYQVEYKDNLDDPAWTPLGAPVAGTGYLLNIDDNNDNAPHRFYRLMITQP
jgi:rhamnogalacturonyl hydrolase YesR